MKKQRVQYEPPELPASPECTDPGDTGHCGPKDLEEIHLELQICSKCTRKSKKKGGFDPVKAFQDLPLDVRPAKCFKQCKRGPNARLVRAGHRKPLAVDGMTEKEAKHKCFHDINTAADAARVANLIQKVTGAQLAELAGESESDSSSDS
ncbi:unnamed protein product [Effrenium voratum]|uniref:Uncharacterized protein n=1 Tax=Effrenium voratum TaxID=2562239 RepID=A0AA36JJD7_9DINO|nr:unnamed protein product [Effrenium voratum]